ncbi:MAG: HEPN domain-containing protein [Candidatus Roizmanbacteria bacterium]|nr:HEPN domain-containing protein [Candidatus Roizmanbacteria bacterium]
MTREQIIEALITKAESDAQTARELYVIKRYDWALFIWHLAIEKVIKAILLQEMKEIEYTHKLLALAKKTDIEISKLQEDQLREITTYNIEARYDDYKLSFYHKADKQYTKLWNAICEEVYQFFKSKLK